MNEEEFEDLLESFTAGKCAEELDNRLKDGTPEDSESWYANGWIDKLLESYKNTRGNSDDRVYSFLGDFAAVHPQYAEAMYDLSLEAMHRDLVRDNEKALYDLNLKITHRDLIRDNGGSNGYVEDFKKKTKELDPFDRFFPRDRSKELNVLFSVAKELFAEVEPQSSYEICAYISERDSTLARQIKNFWDNLPETIENDLKKNERDIQALVDKNSSNGAHDDEVFREDRHRCRTQVTRIACVLPVLLRDKPENADKMVDLCSKAFFQALSLEQLGEEANVYLVQGMKEIALALPQNDDKNFQKMCNLYDLLVSSRLDHGYGHPSYSVYDLKDLALAHPEAADRLAGIFCKCSFDFHNDFHWYEDKQGYCRKGSQRYYREVEQWKKSNLVKPGTLQKLSDLSSKALSVYAEDKGWSKISDKDFIEFYTGDYWANKEDCFAKAWLVDRIMPKMAKDQILFDTYTKLIQERGASFEEDKKLIEMMNQSAKQEFDENDLRHLKGISLYESGDHTVEGSFMHKAVDFLVSNGSMFGLYTAFLTAPDTPAAQAVKEAGIERFGEPVVNFIAEHVNEIKKVPYKHLLLNSRDSAIESQEANFLDAFTDELKNLAQDKYGEKKDDWYCLSNAAEHPQFLKDAGKLWNKMFEKVDEVSISPNWHNNAYVREMFPEQMEELHQHVVKETSDTNVIESKLEYLDRVGIMSKAIREYQQDKNVSLNGNLHFDLAKAGVDNFKDAKRCLDIWCAANERPDRYGSPYNKYEIHDIVQIAKLPVKEAWMFPTMMNAIRAGGMSVGDRMPSEKTLFDACKAWKIAPDMPQRLAEQVGKHSLYGRMLAGAIFEQMTKQGHVTAQEWKENKHLQEQFYKELSQAEKMDRQKALKYYIPDTPKNRKYLAAAILEEAGQEPTKENFVRMYKGLRASHSYEKMLAQEQSNVFGRHVTIARRHKEQEENVSEVETKKSAIEKRKASYLKQKKQTADHKRAVAMKQRMETGQTM